MLSPSVLCMMYLSKSTFCNALLKDTNNTTDMPVDMLDMVDTDMLETATDMPDTYKDMHTPLRRVNFVNNGFIIKR